VPFASFGLPFFAPLRWDILALAAGLVLVLGAEALFGTPDAGASLRVLGVTPGIMVGGTMATRVSGSVATWAGFVAGGVAAALLPGASIGPEGATTAALFTALGMGSMAWRRMRLELTYARRLDVLCGFATVGLVLLALALSAAGGRLVAANGAAFAVGALVLAFSPRSWEPPVRSGTGFPGPGSPWGRSGP
jgi:hypothetical protein